MIEVVSMCRLHMIEKISRCELMVFSAMTYPLFIPFENTYRMKGAFVSESFDCNREGYRCSGNTIPITSCSLGWPLKHEGITLVSILFFSNFRA